MTCNELYPSGFYGDYGKAVLFSKVVIPPLETSNRATCDISEWIHKDDDQNGHHPAYQLPQHQS